MDKTLCINRLYAWVLHNDMEKNNVTIENIIKGIEHMKEAYNHKTSNLASDHVEAADFSSAAYRCAYLHKYAPIHTILVSDIAERVIELHFNYFYDLIITSGCVNVCSLGGGPGSDIVGIVLSLHNAFGPFRVFTSVIDCMPHWNNTLNSLIRETQQGHYGKLGMCFSPQYFNWNYIGANLLEEFSEKVMHAISSADIVNMVKFVSAAVCVDTPSMIKRIFASMKPGAIVFFVDNSVGNVKHVLTKTAEECDLEPLYGPISHEHYINRLVETTRFGYSSCFQTKIAIQVWVKPHRPVQTWIGSPVQVWTPFEKVQRRIVDHAESTPMFNDTESLQDPFCNVSKSLQFDETELDSFDDGSNVDNSFCSDKIEYASDIRKVVLPNQTSSPGFPGYFRKRPLLSTPNFSNLPISPLSNFSPSPLINNINHSYMSPIPFRNLSHPNFEVKRNFDNSFELIGVANLPEDDSVNNRTFDSIISSKKLVSVVVPKDSWNDRSDSGCWSGTSSFSDSFNNDVDYRNLPNCNSGWKYENEPRNEENWYENRENIHPSTFWHARDNQRPSWRNVNLNNNYQPKAHPRYFSNRNHRKFNPYKNRL